ncbi:MAG: CHAT domain-containing protein, partial [Bacteroidota bacterium]
YQVGKADLVARLIATKPSLLWLSGHATNDPPGFLMADGSWLTPADLAAAIREASETTHSVPLYVVLWACRTAVGERYAAPGAAPPFIEALANVGVAGMLATLAPLADDVAIDFAAAILAGVAAGRPLDHTVAYGRATLMDEQVEAGARNDWACPVVWCTALPLGQTDWTATPDDAQRQQLARRLLAPGEELGELDDAGRAQAGLWSEQPRTWVIERQPGSFQVRTAWLGRVMELQRTCKRAVFVLDFANGSARNVIRDWAERAKLVTDGYDDPSRTFRGMLETLRTDSEAGWTLMCKQDNFTLALIEPPEQESWLLARLKGTPAQAVVLAGSFPTAAAEDGWRSDTLQIANGVESMEPPDLGMAAALAVLALPAVAQDLEALDADQFARLRELGHVIETRAGCVMPLSLAAGVLAKLDKQGLAAAHWLAFKALDGPAARARIGSSASEPLRRARFRHALDSGDLAAQSIAAQELMGLYRAERRPSALLDVFERTDFRTIDETWKVAAGWAQISSGSPDDARDILEDARSDELNPVDRATKMSLMAEVEKSSGQPGSIGRATAHLKEAVNHLADGEDERAERERLRIEHDQARLVQFFGEGAAAAAPLYEKIARRWETIAG